MQKSILLSQNIVKKVLPKIFIFHFGVFAEVELFENGRTFPKSFYNYSCLGAIYTIVAFT